MRGPDENANAMELRDDDLYEINDIKVYRKNAVAFGYSWNKDGAFELGHLNVKRVHTLQSIVNDMNFGKNHHHTSSLIYEAFIEKQ